MFLHAWLGCRYTWRLARKYGTRVIWKSVTVGRFPNELITPLAVEHGFEVGGVLLGGWVLTAVEAPALVTSSPW